MTSTQVLVCANSFLKWYDKQRHKNDPITMLDSWLRTWRNHYSLTPGQESAIRDLAIANLPDAPEGVPTPTPSGQNDMFGAPTHEPYGGFPPFVRGSDTSQAAAADVLPRRGSMSRDVLNLFVEVGKTGLIDNEIEHRLGLRHQSASSRRRELELKGFVVRTDAKRLTDSNSWARVYVHRDYYEA